MRPPAYHDLSVEALQARAQQLEEMRRRRALEAAKEEKEQRGGLYL